MATTKAKSGRLHLLTARQVQAAGDGEHGDGGGLLLRVSADRAQWVLRYTAPSGRRREMGLGAAHRQSPAQAGASLTSARGLAHKARELLRQGNDPIDERERQAAAAADAAAKAERQREQVTLARCARDYHARVIEPAARQSMRRKGLPAWRTTSRRGDGTPRSTASRRPTCSPCCST